MSEKMINCEGEPSPSPRGSREKERSPRTSRSRSPRGPRPPAHEPPPDRDPDDFWDPDFSRKELVQHHVVPRTVLWSPDLLPTPVPLNRLEDERETVLTTSRGTQVIIRVNWRQEGAVQVGYGPWLGYSRFFLKDLAEVLEEESVEASSDQKGTDGVSPRVMRKKGTPTQAPLGLRHCLAVASKARILRLGRRPRTMWITSGTALTAAGNVGSTPWAKGTHYSLQAASSLWEVREFVEPCGGGEC